MEQLNLDFSQPTNRLTVIADIERKKNIVKNDYSDVGNRYSSTSPDAVADGDNLGRETGVYLDVYNTEAGTSIDVFERKMNIKFNAFQPNKPYRVEGEA
jgi:hypothetical protein